MTLYVESASLSVSTTAGADPIEAQIQTGGVLIYIPMIAQASASGTDNYTGAMSGHFLVSAGSAFYCGVSLSATATSGVGNCTVTGYLIPTS
jgi:hypothetical protein